MIKSEYQYKDLEKAQAKQKERYYKRVLKMLKEDFYKCYFLTFTFTNKQIEETTEQTRLRNIKAFLNKQAKCYLLNIDYGKLKDREHYHAFIMSRYKTIVFDAINYHIKVEKIASQTTQFYNELTAKRFCGHAFKLTTRNKKIIYSRASKEDKRFKQLAEKKINDFLQTEKGQKIAALYQATKEKNKDTNKAL